MRQLLFTVLFAALTLGCLLSGCTTYSLRIESDGSLQSESPESVRAERATALAAGLEQRFGPGLQVHVAIAPLPYRGEEPNSLNRWWWDRALVDLRVVVLQAERAKELNRAAMEQHLRAQMRAWILDEQRLDIRSSWAIRAPGPAAPEPAPEPGRADHSGVQIRLLNEQEIPTTKARATTSTSTLPKPPQGSARR